MTGGTLCQMERAQMEDQRKYDRTLVDAMRAKQHTEVADGVEVTSKPVPDSDRAHAMDPRVYDIAVRKKALFDRRAQAKWKLSDERCRPDKVTYDLVEDPIERDEFLIRVNDDHMIDLYTFRRADEMDATLPALVYLHGGAFTAGDIRLFEKQMAYVAEHGHALVVFPEYRLAPETPFPGPVEDAFAAVSHVYDHADELGVDAGRIMVAGDSAGGSLANACLLLDDRHMVAKAFELYPGIDMRPIADRASYDWSWDLYPCLPEQADVVRSRIDRIRLGVEGSSDASSLYLQGKSSNNALVSVVCATDEQLRRFPPIVINNAEFDYLRHDAEVFARRLRSLGVEVRLVTYGGCDHGFFDMLGTVVQSEEVALCMADELRAL